MLWDQGSNNEKAGGKYEQLLLLMMSKCRWIPGKAASAGRITLCSYGPGLGREVGGRKVSDRAGNGTN